MLGREEVIAKLCAAQKGDEPILIVGAGINGIGLYRDLALQGIPAIMVDRADFGSGTTAASSRLIHGGLRYLETGEFELVRESVVERNALLDAAPHMVKPQPVLVPANSVFGGMISAFFRFVRLKNTPGAKGIAVVKLGLMFFDRFGRSNRKMPKHRIIPRSQWKRMLPQLAPSIKAVAEYYDTRLTHPERLALELIGDAENDCPDSIAINYIGVAKSDGETVTLIDQINGESFEIRPKVVVNCGGAWVDQINAILGSETELMGGTRGSHLLLNRPDIVKQLEGRMLYFETFDYRACLVYAINETRILMGTTDIRVSSPDRAVCSNEEIDYIFRVAEEVLPGSNFIRDDIVFSYSGIRPLPASSSSASGAISRDHSFHTFVPKGDRVFPLLVLVGGKWTTYRACAEQLANRLFSMIKLERLSTTLGVSIGGGSELTAEDQKSVCDNLRATGLNAQDADMVVERYGSMSAAVAGKIHEFGNTRLTDTSYFLGEIRWLIEEGRVARLADVFFRRTLITYEGKMTRDTITEIGTICAEILNWTESRLEEEISITLDILSSRHLIDTDVVPR